MSENKKDEINLEESIELGAKIIKNKNTGETQGYVPTIMFNVKGNVLGKDVDETFHFECNKIFDKLEDAKGMMAHYASFCGLKFGNDEKEVE